MHKTRDRASGEAVWISLCLVTSGAAHAQIAPPECEECEPYEARYHPREVVLVARKRGLIPEVYVPQLWYARDARFGLGVLAWNETGAIAGTRFAADGVTPRPFFWTPSIVPISNLAAGTYDLLTLAHGASADGLKGFAWDISDSFTIVGGAGDDVEPGEVRARAWEATQPALSCAFEFDLDPAPPRSRPWSVALAIEPKPDVPNELEIVGVGGQECAEWREPFQFHLNLPNCDALLCAVTELAPSFEPPPDLSMPYVSSAREWACDITNHEFLPVGAFDRQSVAQDRCTESTRMRHRCRMRGRACVRSRVTKPSSSGRRNFLATVGVKSSQAVRRRRVRVTMEHLLGVTGFARSTLPCGTTTNSLRPTRCSPVSAQLDRPLKSAPMSRLRSVGDRLSASAKVRSCSVGTALINLLTSGLVREPAVISYSSTPPISWLRIQAQLRARV